MAARGPSPHRGEGGPKGRMRGRMRGASPPWAPSSVSLRSTASPKGEGFGPPRAAAPTDNAPDLPPGGKVARPEAVTDEGTTYGAFPVNGIPQSPPCGGDSPLSQGGRARMVRPVSPSVICFANATSLVRGRLFAGCSLWPPLTRELSSAARLGERSPRIPRRARQGCCALHITEELSLVWDVFIHLLEI